MLKIAISGKANSGKDTIANLFAISKQPLLCKTYALADPIKEIIKIMFPTTQDIFLYGPSKHRSQIVSGAFKNGVPLTYRVLLQDIGTEVGRSYKEDIWLDVLNYRVQEAENEGCAIFIVKDCRFVNEFNHVKKHNFVTIRIKRDSQLGLTHSSEIEQDNIPDHEFDFIIENNGTIKELENKVNLIKSEIINKVYFNK